MKTIPHPSVAALRKVGRAFLKRHRQNGHAVVDMGEPRIIQVREDNVCNTVACHAGWYYMIKMSKKLHLDALRDEYRMASDNSEVDYDMGKALLTEELFGKNAVDGEYTFPTWAGQYEEIWGNVHGTGMFSDEEAFMPEHYDGPYPFKPTLEDIGNWYLAVAKRLEAHLKTPA